MELKFKQKPELNFPIDEDQEIVYMKCSPFGGEKSQLLAVIFKSSLVNIYQICHSKLYEIKPCKTFEGLKHLSVLTWSDNQELFLGTDFGQILMI
jgi:hypothetical protein